MMDSMRRKGLLCFAVKLSFLSHRTLNSCFFQTFFLYNHILSATIFIFAIFATFHGEQHGG